MSYASSVYCFNIEAILNDIFTFGVRHQNKWVIQKVTGNFNDLNNQFLKDFHCQM